MFDGAPVEVETSVHPDRDILIVRLKSQLLADGRLGVDLKFPGVSHNLNPDPADWAHPGVAFDAGDRAQCRPASRSRASSTTRATRCASRPIASSTIATPATHAYRLTSPGSTQITLLVEFAAATPPAPMPAAEDARAAVANWWENFWMHGGVVDFTGSKHPKAQRARAPHRDVAVPHGGELRRAAFRRRKRACSPTAGTASSISRCTPGTRRTSPCGAGPSCSSAACRGISRISTRRRRAPRRMGVKGAWWPKMVGPEGRESPSTVNPFIMWQQPHPIYLAETLYKRAPGPRRRWRSTRTWCSRPPSCSPAGRSTTARQSATCWARPSCRRRRHFDPLTTFNPDLRARVLALRHRHRAGVARAARACRRIPKWDDVLFRLSKLPEKDGLYLAAESQPDLWERARSPQCSKGNTAPDCPNRDHPSFVAALGLAARLGRGSRDHAPHAQGGG